MKHWLCTIIVYALCAPPKYLAENPSPLPVDTVAQERATNDEGYQRFLKLKARLVREHPGEWVAIANGKLLPIDDAGEVRPTKDLKKFLVALETTAAKTNHRYLFRLGEEGDVEYYMGGAELENLLGVVLPEKFGLTITYDFVEGDVTWDLDGNTKVFKGDKFTSDLELTSPGNETRLKANVRHSSAVTASLLVDSRTAESLGLARFEIPGFATVERASGASIKARRAYVVICVPELEIEELVPIGIFPPKK